MDPQRQGYNRAGYFNQMNRNKRDVVLDLAASEGKAAFIELARRSVHMLGTSGTVTTVAGVHLGMELHAADVLTVGAYVTRSAWTACSGASSCSISVGLRVVR